MASLLLIVSEVLSADATGKISKETLSEQTLMQLIIEKVYNTHRFYTPEWDFLPVNSWYGVALHRDGSVESINWIHDETEEDYECFSGSIDLRWVPRHCVRLQLHYHEVHGTVNTNDLPDELKEIMLRGTKLSGRFSLLGLPRRLEVLEIESNNFDGSLAFEDMPRSMTEFFIRSSNFSGSVNLRGLPARLKSLHLSDNAFSGHVDMNDLPPTLTIVYIDGNQFQQEELVIDSRTNRRVTLDSGEDRIRSVKTCDGKEPTTHFRFRNVIEVFVGPHEVQQVGEVNV